ncbi:hypothetical protein [Pararobbsia silviterrae]|uniref:Uncharacterized protein n=1 Tax=Pararobbsia silviterrae TaxID=1792498 RepID=A0A494XKS9_9BURK|nr:hypothetical protein [Pararobbsia silviterrae]RKP50341.1 hypothetical protein D7S86_19755 [Pararobbsia silviterrae]
MEKSAQVNSAATQAIHSHAARERSLSLAHRAREALKTSRSSKSDTIPTPASDAGARPAASAAGIERIDGEGPHMAAPPAEDAHEGVHRMDNDDPTRDEDLVSARHGWHAAHARGPHAARIETTPSMSRDREVARTSVRGHAGPRMSGAMPGDGLVPRDVSADSALGPHIASEPVRASVADAISQSDSGRLADVDVTVPGREIGMDRNACDTDLDAFPACRDSGATSMPGSRIEAAQTRNGAESCAADIASSARDTWVSMQRQEGRDEAATRLIFRFESWPGRPAAVVSLNRERGRSRARITTDDPDVYAALVGANPSQAAGHRIALEPADFAAECSIRYGT